jgi:hypothetical protein
MVSPEFQEILQVLPQLFFGDDAIFGQGGILQQLVVVAGR